MIIHVLFGKNFCVDILLILISLTYGFVGFYKGAVRMIFSAFRFCFVFLISFYLANILAENLIGSPLYDSIFNFLKDLFDGFMPGTFSSTSEALSATSLIENNILRLVVQKLLKNITFSDNLTLGEILAPTVCGAVFKVTLFLILFFIISILSRVISFLLNKTIMLSGAMKINRVFGFLLGIIKGLIVAMLLLMLLSFLSMIGISANLTKFVDSGILSSHLYQNYFLQILDIFSK